MAGTRQPARPVSFPYWRLLFAVTHFCGPELKRDPKMPRSSVKKYCAVWQLSALPIRGFNLYA